MSMYQKLWNFSEPEVVFAHNNSYVFTIAEFLRLARKPIAKKWWPSTYQAYSFLFYAISFLTRLEMLAVLLCFSTYCINLGFYQIRLDKYTETVKKVSSLLGKPWLKV